MIALYSMKGGVGKTTTAVNLAYLAASEGFSTLLFDLDPQGSSSFYFRIKPPKKLTKRVLFQKKKTIDHHIKGTDYQNLDLLPAHISYRNLDLALNSLRKPKTRFSKLFKNYHDEYDFVFIDCPPNITLVAENIFAAADHILLPFVPTTLSWISYKKLMTFFDDKRLDKSRVMVFFSMVEKRKNLHMDMIEKMSSRKESFLKSQIPYSSVVEKMGLHREPVLCYDAQSPAGIAYRELWEEVKDRIEK